MAKGKEIIALLEKIDTKLSTLITLQKSKRLKEATKKFEKGEEI